MRRGGPIKERFESKFRVTPGCWIWMAGLDSRGYGQFSIATKRSTLAHRFSYQLYKGPITDGLWVLHDCDNPKCVNPDHLHLGDVLQNVREMMERGRHVAPKGEGNGCSKLAAADVLAIFADPRSNAKIAADYGVTAGAISFIKTGRSWSHITGHKGHARIVLRGEHSPASKLTSADVMSMYELRKTGMTYQNIGDKFGISMQHAQRILSGKNWKLIHEEVMG